MFYWFSSCSYCIFVCVFELKTTQTMYMNRSSSLKNSLHQIDYSNKFSIFVWLFVRLCLFMDAIFDCMFVARFVAVFCREWKINMSKKNKKKKKTYVNSIIIFNNTTYSMFGTNEWMWYICLYIISTAFFFRSFFFDQIQIGVMPCFEFWSCYIKIMFMWSILN